jgi:serine/threonine protein phosphatase PrpC
VVAPTLWERSVLAKQLRLDVAQLTDVGRKREHNEDNMAYVIPKDPQVMTNKGALFIVADGMGGHAAGEVASEIAVDTVSNVYYQDDSDDVAVSLLHAIRRANASIHQRAAENMLRSGMGTTCVAAVLRGNMAYIANVGDSRAYFLRGSQVKQISQDHSWVAEQVRAGLLTEDQARTHAQRNVITRCLGTQAEVDIDVFHEELKEGDSLVLCSDGLSGLVSDEELHRIVDQFVPQESVYHLVERANENGGPDNITAIVVRVQEVGEEPAGVRHPVRVGGREMGEDTAILGILNSGPLGFAAVNGEGRIPNAPLYISSGPLTSSPDSITAPQSVLGKSKFNRGRLFYPALFLIALLIITAVGGGGYYYLRINESHIVSQDLTSAQRLIKSVQGISDPVVALKTLSMAQKILSDVQKNFLDDGQNRLVTQLQGDLVEKVKATILAYNQNAGITLLSCTNTATYSIQSASTNNPQGIARAQGPKGPPFLYALAQDNGLYQVEVNSNSQYNLVSRLNPAFHTLNISSNGSYLIVLAEQLNDNAPTGYMLNMYQPDQAGNLGKPVSAQIGTNYMKDGYTPALTTAWGNNVYVMLASQTTTNARVLSYTLETHGHLTTPKAIEFSISAPIVSIAAFPNQLFLLLLSGEVLSLPLLNRGQPVPAEVLVQPPIAPPLAASVTNFNVGTPVPTVTQVSQGSTFLSVSVASSMSAGQVNGVPHLYIGEPVKNHRVLDLNFPPVGGQVTPTPAPTGTSSATSSVVFQLNHQYVSSSNLSQVKSLTVDSQDQQLDILSSQNKLVTIPVGQQTTNLGQPTTCSS